MSNDLDSSNIQRDCLSEWRQKDKLELSTKTLDITYASKPPIFDQLVTVLASCKDKILFSGLLNTLPPHDIMSIDLHGTGTTLEALEILKFLSEKINAHVRMDMSANDDIFTETEIKRSGSILEIIPHSSERTGLRRR